MTNQIEITNIINSHLKENPWNNTALERYTYLDPKNKGSVGEEIIKTYVQENCPQAKITKRLSPGHDAIINGYRTEMKFSVATKRNMNYQFTFNHIGIEKDWDRIIFMGINGDLNEKVVWFTKEDILEILKTSTCLAHQQGGNSSKNDDYISANKNSQILMNHPLAKSINQW